MHIHHDHVAGGHTHEHDHSHTHEHECHCHDHEHDHECHCHDHEHDHECHCHDHEHEHEHHCAGGCQGHCHEHTPMEELAALMRYMVSHNTSHANELAQLAQKLAEAGNPMAFEQVMAAVSDFEKGNMRLSLVLASLDVK